jgi:hypothetical protein
MARTARIIIVESCEQCPHMSIEETNKKEYLRCWAVMKNLKDINCIDKECPLEEIDIELEGEDDEWDD